MPDFKLNPNVPKAALKYAKSLLPFADWIRRYNRTWLIGDVIAGLTVGMLLVPQALAYAKLAGVPLEYGLYTGFFGAVFYTFFSTSKDVTIGPTAVLSQLCGQVLLSYNTGDNRIDPVVFLVCVAFVSGLMEVAIGLLNFGIIVDFIPVSVIVGFTTGAAISIITGQLAGLLGIPNINKSDATHIILYNTLKSIPLTKLDASIGISALICLMGFRIVTKHYLKRGYSWFSWVGYSSNVVVIIVFTFISFLINQGAKKPYFSVIGIVPKGLGVFKVPSLDHLPVILSASSTIVLVSILEHLAVAKSLGRLNGYTPDSNQEIIALGVTNTVGAFMGAYPSCGSFSRSSVLSRSGSRSPLVGFFIAGVVVMALYVVTPAFYFIPNSVLSAMIIAAITDLIARPKIIKEFWEIERTDFVTCLIALLVTIFVSIETAIFASVGFSAAVLLYRGISKVN